MTDVNLGQMLSTTLKKYRPTLTDNIHNSNALFYLLKEKKAIREEDGGERIVEPLMYATNNTAGWYDGYDQLDVTPQEGIDAAEFNWKQASASITISGKQIRQNAGRKEKIIDLLEAKTKQAELSLRQQLTQGLFSDGTGSNNKQLTGLEAMVLDSGTYGGVNSGTYTWWRSYVDNT
ncbi:MAG: phage major capsid protein, partial [Bacteroidetes bacterium]